MKICQSKTCKLYTKAEVKSEIEECKKFFIEKSSTDGRRTAAYYSTLIGLIDKFIDTLDKSILMEHLEEDWGYRYNITYRGIELFLEHYYEMVIEESDDNSQKLYSTDQAYRLFGVDSKLLTVEEYADRYKVETVTVRQWIRRGKIRTAIKYGNEWRIPELTELPRRGWSDSSYVLDEDIELEKKYEYLRNCQSLWIIQDDYNKKLYQIMLLGIDKEYKVMYFDVKEKEQLELYCISSPHIHYQESMSENWEQDIFYE